MKKPKPKVGQVWKCLVDGLWLSIHSQKVDISSVYDGFVLYSGGRSRFEMFVRNFEFLPQNDLEWLAINVVKWRSMSEFVIKLNDMPYSCVSYAAGAVSKWQWQAKRYELGLDDKPHYKYINNKWELCA